MARAASRGRGLRRARYGVACKPEREGAPNTRLQLTVAMHFGAREGGGESRGCGALGRPQLKRHPLGASRDRRRASLLAQGWQGGSSLSTREASWECRRNAPRAARLRASGRRARRQSAGLGRSATGWWLADGVGPTPRLLARRAGAGEAKCLNVVGVRQRAASLVASSGEQVVTSACNSYRERAPNTRLQLTGALALLRQGGCRE